jgi:hypothetical protein
VAWDQLVAHYCYGGRAVRDRGPDDLLGWMDREVLFGNVKLQR